MATEETVAETTPEVAPETPETPAEPTAEVTPEPEVAAQ